MTQSKDGTASFMLRFTQKIYKDEQNEEQVQWRGNIRHVQNGTEKRFTEVNEAINFIQSTLHEVTLKATDHKTSEEQEGLLQKSFNMWKKVAQDAPKMVFDTIKDPKKGVSQIQSQIQEQISNVKEEIGQRIDVDSWMVSSKDDYHNIMQKLEQLTAEVSTLNKKVDKISKAKK